MKQDTFDAARDWAGFLFRPLLISAMTTCIAAAWIGVLESDLAPWRGGYLIWIVGMATLEALLVERQLRRRRLALLEPRVWQARLAGIGIVVLVIKAASYLPSGWQALARDILRWADQPLSFFDFEFVIGIVIVGTLWMLSSSMAGNLAEIEDENNLPGEPEAARARLQEDFMLGAFFLLFAVGTQRVALSPAGLSLRPAQVSGLAVLPIVYVGLGVLLFGQARLSLLLAQWKRQEVPVSSGIERRWASWGVLFVGGISTLVLLLPAGETSLGVYVLSYIAFAFLIVAQVFVFLLYLLLSLLLLPLGLLPSQSSQPPRLPQLPVFPPPTETRAAPNWLSSIWTVFLGIVVVLVTFLILRAYWRDRQASGIWKIMWDIVCAAWKALLEWLLGSTRRVQQILRRSPTSREFGPARITLSWRAWRARTSRERVRRLYLALLERAARVGHPRRPAQTPFEYSTDLRPHLSDPDGLSTLTEAFVTARYSRQDFTEAQVSRLHRLWQRLRNQLRRL